MDRTVRLLQAALEEPEMRLPRATALVDYHVRRNEVARKSHAKTWRANHRGVEFLRPIPYAHAAGLAPRGVIGRRTHAAPRVTVKIFMEQYVILEMRIRRQF